MYFKRLKDLREDKDMYQKQIANILNIHQQNYSRYETGEKTMPIEKLIILADFYDTTIDYIVGRTNIKNKKDYLN